MVCQEFATDGFILCVPFPWEVEVVMASTSFHRFWKMQQKIKFKQFCSVAYKLLLNYF